MSDPRQAQYDAMNAHRADITVVFRSGHREQYRETEEHAVELLRWVLEKRGGVVTAGDGGFFMVYRLEEVTLVRYALRPVATAENDPRGRPL